VLAAQADGHEVSTIEGLEADDGTLHPVQQVLLEEFGFQCGFCTPGVAMTMAELVKAEERFDQHSAREALVGNICRCTGYTTIVDSLIRAQAQSAPELGP
jgi:carbon-monoxide dehydrogenase small subunit